MDQVTYPKLFFGGIGCLQFFSLLIDQVCRVLEVSEDVSVGKRRWRSERWRGDNMKADVVLVFPALLRKRIVHFAENNNRIQRIVVIGSNGTGRVRRRQAEKGMDDMGTYAADRGTTIVASRS